MVERLIKGIPFFLLLLFSCSNSKKLSDLNTSSFGVGYNALLNFQLRVHEINLKTFETAINISESKYPNVSIENCKISSVKVIFFKNVSFMEFLTDSFVYKNGTFSEISTRFEKGKWEERGLNGTIIKSIADIEVDLDTAKTFRMKLDCKFSIINDSLILDKCQSDQ